MKALSKLQTSVVPAILASLIVGCSSSFAGEGISQGADAAQSHLTDAKGMTYYSFDKDNKNASDSACYGGCAIQWPPVPAEASSGESFGIIVRKDGSEQLTHNGLPMYYFVGDVKAGDQNGKGLGGVWHLVKPTKAAKSSSSKSYSYGSNYSY
jgi:predicted lipoprotein with Yx(FWY)xxD motif